MQQEVSIQLISLQLGQIRGRLKPSRLSPSHLQTRWRALVSYKVRFSPSSLMNSLRAESSIYAASPIPDLKSFQCSSPSEFDKKFFGEQSLLAALSLDQLSTSKVSCDPAADWSDSKASMLASLCLSDIVSPCLGLPLHGSTAQEADACNKLSVPVQAKISTPQILLQKPKNAACFDQSYGDLTASQTSWDVSLIKAENSPMFCTESNSQEQVWSPKTPHSAPEV